MLTKKEIIIPTYRERDIVADVTYKKDDREKPLVIFCHGYKGFKDWGAWNLVANHFADKGFAFLKFNFSHNGGTVDNPIDFPDLDAFGKNTYTKEVEDLHTVINWAIANNGFRFDKNNISVIGHSRGGGIALIVASESRFVRSAATWAGVSDFKQRFIKGEQLEKWREVGVYYIRNGRTNQKMPHYYFFYEDFMQNEQRLNIKSAVMRLRKPQLIIHGNNDEVVGLDEAQRLKQWNPLATLAIIDGAGHTFGSKHPWDETNLPNDMERVVDITVSFLALGVFKTL